MFPGDSTDMPTPYSFVGDEAFPLKPYLMCPFPGRQLDCGRGKCMITVCQEHIRLLIIHLVKLPSSSFFYGSIV